MEPCCHLPGVKPGPKGRVRACVVETVNQEKQVCANTIFAQWNKVGEQHHPRETRCGKNFCSRCFRLLGTLRACSTMPMDAWGGPEGQATPTTPLDSSHFSTGGGLITISPLIFPTSDSPEFTLPGLHHEISSSRCYQGSTTEVTSWQEGKAG